MNRSLISVIRGLVGLSSEKRWLIPTLALLSLIAFLFEALAIYLLLPLFNVLLSSAGTGVTGELGRTGAVLSSIGFEASVPVLIGIIVACVFLKGLTALASQATLALASSTIGDSLRCKTFRTILRARQDFHDRQEPGALLNTLATETWRLSQGMQALAGLITHTCAILVFFALMIALSWQLTLITGVVTLLIVAIVGAVTARAKRFGEEAVAANRELSARIVEGLAGLRVIRLFGQERMEAARFAEASGSVRRSFLKMDVIGAVPLPLLELLFAGLLGILILSAGAQNIMNLVVFLALLQRMQPHTVAVVQSRIGLLGLNGPLQDVLGLLKDNQAEPLAEGAHLAPKPIREIRFDSVSYTYPNASSPALQSVSFTIPVGQTTALVGTSGAGKSTILSLICRLMDPLSGSIRVDGEDLRELQLASWRSRIAVVPQDVYLFNASIRENIAYGRADVSQADIENAGRASLAHDFIVALPQGYETRVGDRGVRFSGGQRQRLALARAIVRDPDLLILDEATNALDSLSEKLVRDAVTRVGANRTVLVVAHRMASIEHADQVIVLDRGQVAEVGSPAALAASGGLYARLHRAEKLSVSA